MSGPYVFKKKWKRIVTTIFDSIGGLCTFFISRNFKFDTGKVKKILVIRIDHLGDTLLTRPALKCLRDHLPDVQIHLLTTSASAPLCQLDPFIDKVISFPNHWFQTSCSVWVLCQAFFGMCARLCAEKYDGAIDFRGDLRANTLMFLAGIPLRFGYGLTGGGWMLTHEKKYDHKLHQVLLNLKLLEDWGVHFDPQIDNLRVRYPGSSRVHIEKSHLGLIQPYAVVHSGAGNPQKEWPFHLFLQTASALLQFGKVKTVVFVGTVSDRKKNPLVAAEQTMDLRGDTELHELAFLLEKAAIFIGNDSGPAHLAAAQGCPVAVVASSTNEIQFWHPWTKKLAIISSSAEKPATVEYVRAEVEKLIEPQIGAAT